MGTSESRILNIETYNNTLISRELLLRFSFLHPVISGYEYEKVTDVTAFNDRRHLQIQAWMWYTVFRNKKIRGDKNEQHHR